ncbi:MAG: hypothetical protein LQ352_000036 [Teloschistes flavicans]|nr:MAG: hypothetical protein LQ352_000036 [Teloschistes flavicans]
MIVWSFDPYRRIIQTFSVPSAVLDLRFSPHIPDTLAVATSTGAVLLLSFQPENASPLVQTNSFEVATACSGFLVLSLAWAPLSPSFLAFTLSDGTVGVLDVDQGTVIFEMSQAHSLEAWVVAWSAREMAPALYTGGDDSAICCHRFWVQTRRDQASQDPSGNCAVVRDRKIHGAGVTAILPLGVDRSDGEILLTGSYDEHIRVMRVSPTPSRPEVLAEKRLDGGVWQLRHLRGEGDLVLANQDGGCVTILASCMHAGCRILEIHLSADDSWTIETVGAFEAHESMNYASDAQTEPSGKKLEDMTFISTSFYDKKLCVWRLQDNEP